MIYEPATINWDTWVDFNQGFINMWIHTPLYVVKFVTFMAGEK